MNKKLLVCIGLLVISSASLNFSFKEETKDEVKIEFLNRRNANVTRLSNDEIILDTSVDAYVLDEFAFNDLNKDNTQSYLDDGGVLIVNDNDVTGNQVKSKIDSNVTNFDNTTSENNYGFYVKNNGEENIVVTLSLGFVNEEGSETVGLVADEISETQLANDIYERSFDIIPPSDDEITPITQYCGMEIASTYTDKLLYDVIKNVKCAAYTTFIDIWDVAKLSDWRGTLVGVYDIVGLGDCTVYQDYSMYSYSMRLTAGDNLTIYDQVDLIASGSNVYTLTEGPTSFTYDLLHGQFDVSAYYSFTYSATDIESDYTDTDSRYWKVNIYNGAWGADYGIKPMMRVYNVNDYGTWTATAVIEEFIITDRFLRVLALEDPYRDAINIMWSHDGYEGRSVTTGVSIQ